MLKMNGTVKQRGLGEESLQMWDLNKRLENYLGRVKFLEEENELLRAEIKGLRGKADQKPWRSRCEEELEALRQNLEELGRDKAKVDLEKHNLSEEVKAVWNRCEKEKLARESAKKLLAESWKDMEEEKRAQIWLKEQAFQLESELQFLQSVHEEEKVRLQDEMEQLSQSFAEFQVVPATFRLVEVEDFSGKLSEIWKGAVEVYGREVSQLEESLAEAKENLRSVVEGNKKNSLKMKSLQKEMENLKARKEILEKTLSDQWLKQCEEVETFQVEIESLEQTKYSLSEQIIQVLEDRHHLMHLKVSLGLEVATYRALLEAENVRLPMPVTGQRKTAVKKDVMVEFNSSKLQAETASSVRRSYGSRENSLNLSRPIMGGRSISPFQKTQAEPLKPKLERKFEEKALFVKASEKASFKPQLTTTSISSSHKDNTSSNETIPMSCTQADEIPLVETDSKSLVQEISKPLGLQSTVSETSVLEQSDKGNELHEGEKSQCLQEVEPLLKEVGYNEYDVCNETKEETAPSQSPTMEDYILLGTERQDLSPAMNEQSCTDQLITEALEETFEKLKGTDKESDVIQISMPPSENLHSGSFQEMDASDDTSSHNTYQNESEDWLVPTSLGTLGTEAIKQDIEKSSDEENEIEERISGEEEVDMITDYTNDIAGNVSIEPDMNEPKAINITYTVESEKAETILLSAAINEDCISSNTQQLVDELEPEFHKEILINTPNGCEQEPHSATIQLDDGYEANIYETTDSLGIQDNTLQVGGPYWPSSEEGSHKLSEKIDEQYINDTLHSIPIKPNVETVETADLALDSAQESSSQHSNSEIKSTMEDMEMLQSIPVEKELEFEQVAEAVEEAECVSIEVSKEERSSGDDALIEQELSRKVRQSQTEKETVDLNEKSLDYEDIEDGKVEIWETEGTEFLDTNIEGENKLHKATSNKYEESDEGMEKEAKPSETSPEATAEGFDVGMCLDEEGLLVNKEKEMVTVCLDHLNSEQDKAKDDSSSRDYFESEPAIEMKNSMEEEEFELSPKEEPLDEGYVHVYPEVYKDGPTENIEWLEEEISNKEVDEQMTVEANTAFETETDAALKDTNNQKLEDKVSIGIHLAIASPVDQLQAEDEIQKRSDPEGMFASDDDVSPNISETFETEKLSPLEETLPDTTPLNCYNENNVLVHAMEGTAERIDYEKSGHTDILHDIEESAATLDSSSEVTKNIVISTKEDHQFSESDFQENSLVLNRNADCMEKVFLDDNDGMKVEDPQQQNLLSDEEEEIKDTYLEENSLSKSQEDNEEHDESKFTEEKSRTDVAFSTTENIDIVCASERDHGNIESDEDFEFIEESHQMVGDKNSPLAAEPLNQERPHTSDLQDDTNEENDDVLDFEENMHDTQNQTQTVSTFTNVDASEEHEVEENQYNIKQRPLAPALQSDSSELSEEEESPNASQAFHNSKLESQISEEQSSEQAPLSTQLNQSDDVTNTLESTIEEQISRTEADNTLQKTEAVSSLSEELETSAGSRMLNLYEDSSHIEDGASDMNQGENGQESNSHDRDETIEFYEQSDHSQLEEDSGNSKDNILSTNGQEISHNVSIATESHEEYHELVVQEERKISSCDSDEEESVLEKPLPSANNGKREGSEFTENYESPCTEKAEEIETITNKMTQLPNLCTENENSSFNTSSLLHEDEESDWEGKSCNNQEFKETKTLEIEPKGQESWSSEEE
ncbi:nestin [Latimeria chalumnae]|uniref:nestin n=1 Tax=Latimeria chalumnae TaxID=7897 RepID=UPI0003C11C18|nr:PREDICTED: nestin [Latimeria chalumnae]|eukprot:XP_005991729.1 PREDICTED: nestin [Latimeria chalumnae]